MDIVNEIKVLKELHLGNEALDKLASLLAKKLNANKEVKSKKK